MGNHIVHGDISNLPGRFDAWNVRASPPAVALSSMKFGNWGNTVGLHKSSHENIHVAQTIHFQLARDSIEFEMGRKKLDDVLNDEDQWWISDDETDQIQSIRPTVTPTAARGQRNSVRTNQYTDT